jgi:hypothetical protein
VPGPSHLEDEFAVAELKKYKFLGSEQILAELLYYCASSQKGR